MAQRDESGESSFVEPLAAHDVLLAEEAYVCDRPAERSQTKTQGDHEDFAQTARSTRFVSDVRSYVGRHTASSNGIGPKMMRISNAIRFECVPFRYQSHPWQVWSVHETVADVEVVFPDLAMHGIDSASVVLQD